MFFYFHIVNNSSKGLLFLTYVSKERENMVFKQKLGAKIYSKKFFFYAIFNIKIFYLGSDISIVGNSLLILNSNFFIMCKEFCQQNNLQYHIPLYQKQYCKCKYYYMKDPILSLKKYKHNIRTLNSITLKCLKEGERCALNFIALNKIGREKI